MTTTEYALSSLTEMDRHVRLVASASGVREIVEAIDAYLGSWSTERIRSLQKIDGGWGPFDDDQRIAPLHGLADVTRVADAVSRQCAALKTAGIPPTPELLELDLFFFFARQIAEEHMPPAAPALAVGGAGYNHWSDRRAA